MKWSKYKIDTYPCTVYFCLGGTNQEISAKLKRLKLTPSVQIESEGESSSKNNIGWTIRLTTHKDTFAVLVWVKDCRKHFKNVMEIAREIATVSHECNHATFYLCEYIGQKIPDADSVEFFNYLHDSLVRKALVTYWS